MSNFLTATNQLELYLENGKKKHRPLPVMEQAKSTLSGVVGYGMTRGNKFEMYVNDSLDTNAMLLSLDA
jgi:hypothetical protein